MIIQTQVLNYFLQSKDPSLIVLNNLTKDYFSDYVPEWTYIEEHYKQYGNIPDRETFVDRFPTFKVINVEESPQYLITELFKDYQIRQLTKSYNAVGKCLNDKNLEEAINVYKEINEHLSAGIALDSVDIIQDKSRLQDYEDRVNNPNDYFISTGLKELDDLLGGWDRKEELATVIARTNVGKTWILIKFAEAAVKQGLNVGLYSGEMTINKVAYRFDTWAGHISNGGLVHGNKAIEKEYIKYMEKLGDNYTGHLRIITPTKIGGPAGVNALRAFIEKEHLDMLFIDQHSLLEDDRGAKNPVEKAANISRDLKNLQVMKCIPIISVSQMNRNKNEAEPDIIDAAQIAQTDRIGQDSTVIIGLSRDKKDDSLMRMQIVKARDAQNKKSLSYIVDFNKGTCVYIPEDDVKAMTDSQSITDDESNESSWQMPTAQSYSNNSNNGKNIF